MAVKNPLENKIKAISKVALTKVLVVYKEISDYVKENGIEDSEILANLKDAQGWIDGKIQGSHSLAVGIYTELSDIINGLYQIPEHRIFASKYVELYKNRPDMVSRYLAIEEITDLIDLESEADAKRQTELWGQLDRISLLYTTIKHGRERHKSLVVEHRAKKSTKTSVDVLNHGMVIGEWTMIEEKRFNQGKIYLFDIKKIKPWLLRLHNYLLKEITLKNKAPLPDSTNFDADKSRLHVRGNTINIQKFSDQYHALRIIFEDKKEVGKEWFFSEIAEKADPKNLTEKRYYNAVYQVKQKLKSIGITDFFTTTRQSALITKKYLS